MTDHSGWDKPQREWPFLLAIAALIAGLLGFGLCLGGCASGVKVAYGSLAGAERIVQAAAEQFPSFDKAKRQAIIRNAQTMAEGNQSLIDWDESSEKIVNAIEGAHATVQLAKDGIKDVQAGLREPRDLSYWILPAVRAAANLQKLLMAFGLELKLVG